MNPEAQVGLSGDQKKAAIGVGKRDFKPWQTENRRVTVDGVCAGCLKPIRRRAWGKGLGQIYCDMACKRSRYARQVVVGKEILALIRIAKYVEKKPWELRRCDKCQERIGHLPKGRKTCDVCKEVAYRNGRATCKSRKKHKRIYRAKRRAIERGSNADRIDPIEVFDRDGWKCYICGVETPMSKRGTYEPDAPELEHVIPLALGGTHTMSNVKCACRSCNQEKGVQDRGG